MKFLHLCNPNDSLFNYPISAVQKENCRNGCYFLQLGIEKFESLISVGSS